MAELKDLYESILKLERRPWKQPPRVMVVCGVVYELSGYMMRTMGDRPRGLIPKYRPVDRKLGTGVVCYV